MTNTISNKVLNVHLASIIVCFLLFARATEVSGADPVILASWDEGPGPFLGIDYTVSTSPPASPDFPSVELIAEALTWRIWSKDTDNPGNVGDIGTITSPHPENFGVKIEDDTGGPGARTVKGIILDPTNAGNFSRITGGEITGNLVGDLTVIQDSAGSGGDVVSFQIDGDAIGNITIATVSSLIIQGNTSGTIQVAEIAAGGLLEIGELISFPPAPGQGQVSGSVEIGVVKHQGQWWSHGDLMADLTVTDKIEGASMRVDGNITAGAMVRINDIVGVAGTDSIVFLCSGNEPPIGPGALEFAGQLVLDNGVPQNQYVQIDAPLTSGASIDLTSDNVAGTLWPSRGGSGRIVNGGAVTGTVMLAGGYLILRHGRVHECGWRCGRGMRRVASGRTDQNYRRCDWFDCRR